MRPLRHRDIVLVWYHPHIIIIIITIIVGQGPNEASGAMTKEDPQSLL